MQSSVQRASEGGGGGPGWVHDSPLVWHFVVRWFPHGAWVVTPSSLHRVCRVIIVHSAVGPVRVASFMCVWGPVLSVLPLWPVLRGSSSIVFLMKPRQSPRSSLHEVFWGIVACWAMGLVSFCVICV